MPLPMNTTARRLGNAGAPRRATAAPAGNDSSQGNAIATPAPRRNERRAVARIVVLSPASRGRDAELDRFMARTSSRREALRAPGVQELGTGHDPLDPCGEPVVR